MGDRKWGLANKRWKIGPPFPLFNPPSSILHPLSSILYLLSSLFLLSACISTVTPPAPVVLKAAGSTSMGPLLTDLATAYSAQHPHVTFDIQGGGSQLGQSLVEAGRVDLGLVSWPPQNLPPSLRSIPIARDAVAIIVHPDNSSQGLSLIELRYIFSGRLLNWQDVGGPDSPIQVVSREDGSGTRTAFESLVMDKQPVTPTAIVLPNSQAVVEFVAKNPNAVAYVSAALINADVRAIPIEGTPPSLDSLAANSYLLTRDLILLAPDQSQPELNNFIEFALSPAGQTLVGAKWGRIR